MLHKKCVKKILALISSGLLHKFIIVYTFNFYLSKNIYNN